MLRHCEKGHSISLGISKIREGRTYEGQESCFLNGLAKDLACTRTGQPGSIKTTLFSLHVLLPGRNPMAGAQGFLDNLENLRLTTSVALEYLQEYLYEFAKSATPNETRQAERLVSKIRTISEQLEKEFSTLERLLTKARSN